MIEPLSNAMKDVAEKLISDIDPKLAKEVLKTIVDELPPRLFKNLLAKLVGFLIDKGMTKLLVDMQNTFNAAVAASAQGGPGEKH